MNHFRRVITLVIVGLMLNGAGCVSQKRADDLQTLYRRSQEQVIDLQAQLQEAQARIKAMQSAPVQQDPALLARLEAAISERDTLNAALADAKRALIRASMTTVLPAELDNQLVELADAHRALMQYDKKRGMLKFASDLTFASGSTKINRQAQAGLLQLAAMMRKPVASRFDLRIVGHTDNVRIGKAQTRAKHPTNWHLSVHRAIAVKDVLVKAGLPAGRIEVAGHGEYQPIAQNGRRGNAANRRVEIYIVPSTYQMPKGVTLQPTKTKRHATRSTKPTIHRTPTKPEPFK